MQKLNTRLLIGAGTGLTVGLVGLLTVGPALADTTAAQQVAPTEWSQVVNPYGIEEDPSYNMYSDYVGPADGPLQPNLNLDWRENPQANGYPVVDLSWNVPAPASNCVRLVNGFTIALTANEQNAPATPLPTNDPDLTLDDAPLDDALAATPFIAPSPSPSDGPTDASETPEAKAETSTPTPSGGTETPPTDADQTATAQGDALAVPEAPAVTPEPTPDPNLSYAQALVAFSADSQATIYHEDTVSGLFSQPLLPGLNIILVPTNTPSSATLTLNEPLEYADGMSAILAAASFGDVEQTWTINQVRFNVTDTCAAAPGIQTTEPVVTAAAASGSSTLANTGSEQNSFLVGGVALVIAGGTVLLGLRRRATRSTPASALQPTE
ncbi:LPXTG cell wall anchor domain-containing protein [Lysinibacter cavernae]|uniref:LPXTG-motif cell wall-anchored protein n=1 Tax=Lysinibacter cavernae TaxID=1640652 RepID=A0A7X5R2R4_9MICO|nr:LPXTG cell wall anchor domain-containing protein [Lysinibacter cavernae]NIH54603.1 LPXTG-motif cell wall-anchored protein [Lysinibacter cavernae]